MNGIEKTGFFTAFGWSAFITVFSVAAIILFTSMTAYYLTRVKTGVTNILYYMFVFSMIVPFQMVMFTMSKLANMTHLKELISTKKIGVKNATTSTHRIQKMITLEVFFLVIIALPPYVW